MYSLLFMKGKLQLNKKIDSSPFFRQISRWLRFCRAVQAG